MRWKCQSPNLIQTYEEFRGPEVATAPDRCIPSQPVLSPTHLFIHSLKQALDCFNILTSELIILSFERVTEELGDFSLGSQCVSSHWKQSRAWLLPTRVHMCTTHCSVKHKLTGCALRPSKRPLVKPLNSSQFCLLLVPLPYVRTPI